MTRPEAWELLCEFTKSESLRKHGLAVETCVAAYARHFGEDEEEWAVTALLHDFDWEIHPTLPDHPTKGEPILAARGVSEEIRRAILSHADFTGIPRVSMLEKTLFACDELAGFSNGHLLRQAVTLHCGSGCEERHQEDEGQRLRPHRQPRRHPQRRS